MRKGMRDWCEAEYSWICLHYHSPSSWLAMRVMRQPLPLDQWRTDCVKDKERCGGGRWTSANKRPNEPRKRWQKLVRSASPARALFSGLTWVVEARLPISSNRYSRLGWLSSAPSLGWPFCWVQPTAFLGFLWESSPSTDIAKNLNLLITLHSLLIIYLIFIQIFFLLFFINISMY